MLGTGGLPPTAITARTHISEPSPPSPNIRIPEASPQIKRQVFQAFDLQIAFDKREGRLEISATVSEAVAQSFNTTDLLARGGLSVVPKDIAGAGFEPATFGL